MPQYQSPGAAFSSGLEEAMLNQATARRQAMMDDLARKREARLEQADLDTAQEHRDKMAQHQQDMIDAAHEKNVTEAEKSAAKMMPGDIPSQERFTQATTAGVANDLYPKPAPTALGMGITPGIDAGPTIEQDPMARPYIGNIADRKAAQAKATETDLGTALVGVTDRPTFVKIATAHGVPYAQIDDMANAYMGKDQSTSYAQTGGETNPATGNAVVFKGGKFYDSITNDVVAKPSPKPPSPESVLAHADAVSARNAATAAHNEDKQTGRLDNSYKTESSRIDKIAGPVEGAVQRMGRLVDTLDQKNPQSDSLIAPELMVVMAGGAGSGIRINDAEIKRVAGGETQATALKAYMNKWSLDPNHPQIPEPQRSQIYSLIGVVRGKLHKKVDAIGDARDVIADTNSSIDAHRQATKKLQKALSDIDDNQGPSTTLSAADLIKKYGGQ